MEEDNLKKLLESVAPINENLKECEAERSFNIFHILGIEEKEVLMTKVLAELLNPQGTHGYGTLFLKKFLALLNNKELNESVLDTIGLNNTIVSREHYTDNGRRIDIYLKHKNFCYVIEVKFKADDQPNQLYDYYEYACKDYGDSNTHGNPLKKIKCIYLTAKKHKKPSENSITSPDGKDKLNEEIIHCISFEEEISEMICSSEEEIIKRICSYEEYIKSRRVRCILEQYKDAIKKWEYEMKKKTFNEVSSILLKSKDNYECGRLIYNCFSDCNPGQYLEDKLLKNIYEKLGNLFESFPNTFLHMKRCCLKGETNHYTFQLVSPVLSKESDGSYSVFFTIGKSEELYAPVFGYCYGQKKSTDFDMTLCKAKREKIFEKYFEDNCADESWPWLSWRYLSNKDEDVSLSPNFKTMNESAINLIGNDDKQKEYIENNIRSIIEFIFIKNGKSEEDVTKFLEDSDVKKILGDA